jgi:hypothetical protein
MQFTRMRDATITMSQAMLSHDNAVAGKCCRSLKPPRPARLFRAALSNSRNSRSHRARG